MLALLLLDPNSSADTLWPARKPRHETPKTPKSKRSEQVEAEKTKGEGIHLLALLLLESHFFCRHEVALASHAGRVLLLHPLLSCRGTPGLCQPGPVEWGERGGPSAAVSSQNPHIKPRGRLSAAQALHRHADAFSRWEAMQAQLQLHQISWAPSIADMSAYVPAGPFSLRRHRRCT